MNQERIEQLKEQLKLSLSLDKKKQLALDTALESVSNGITIPILIILVVITIGSATVGLTIVSIISGLVIFFDIFVKADYRNRQLQVLASTVGEWFYETRFSALPMQLPGLPLRSLKYISCSIFAHILFDDQKNICFSFSGRSYKDVVSKPAATPWFVKRTDESRSKIDNSGAWEISPGIFFKFVSCSIRCKCDFRIIRDSMSQNQVAWLFKLVADLIPEVPLEAISVDQYSSTKKFLFTKEYLDSGTISYIYSKHTKNKAIRKADVDAIRTNANKTTAILTQDLPPILYESDKPVEYAREQSKKVIAKDMPRRSLSVKRATVLEAIVRTAKLLSNLFERRKEVELSAMSVVMRYEKRQGRNPEDVSKKNLGFDILSHEKDNQTRKIEVKGFGNIGDVILTQNERDLACGSKDNYYLYIVENCSINGKQRLVIRQNIHPEELQPQASKFIVSAENVQRSGQYMQLSL